MKRVMTIQDISCIGKCSLTVALPIISAMGIETAVVPTAVLSTHTQFSNVAFRDLTDDMLPILSHWKREGFTFDAIYTGYLGSIRQIDIVSRFFKTFRSANTGIIVDPAMADNGRLYTGFDDAFVVRMRDLCAEADIILPNISEACLMAGVPYVGENASEQTIRALLKELARLGVPIIVITGTTLDDNTFGFTMYNARTDSFLSYGNPRVPMRSHGTGDIFASAFTGALTRGAKVESALKIAADYTSACILNAYNDPDRRSYCVNFEAELPYLIARISEI